jgi:hypothetical protein
LWGTGVLEGQLFQRFIMQDETKHRKAIHIAFVALLLLPVFLSLTTPSCKDQITNPGSDIVFPDSNISFVNYVEPLFQQRCISCHNSAQNYGNLDLEISMWQALIDHQPQIVVPHRGNNSLLVQRLEGNNFGPQMPLNSTPLTTNQINGVKKWIDEGASNN